MDIEKIISELTLEEKAGLCSGRDFWHTKAVERLGIPSVMMCDGPHGLRKQLGEGDHLGINVSIETTCYPTASALASSFDPEVLDELGHALGQECQAEDVAMLLGPGLNMKRSPLCGRNFEYFSEDPYLAGELASSYIRALQSEGVASCVKHFAANNQETRRMSGSSNVDERTFHELYLPAFEKAVKEGGTRSVMCAYNAVNGTYCSENKELLTDILRKDWGYEGFVVTDWGAVKNRVKGLEAGVDLEMPGGGGVQDEKIVAAVRSGELSEDVLDNAVRNMLQFISDYQENRRPDETIDREACRKLSAQLSAECAVLLKNRNILPISKTAKVAFIGEFAENPRYQGSGSSHINVPHSVSAMEAMAQGAVDGFNGEIVYAHGYDVHGNTEEGMQDEAVRAAAESDVAVIFAGLPDAYETEGCDRETMAMPANQNALIEAVAAVQKNTIVVLYGGSPMELPWLEQVSGVLCMYLGGERVGESTVKLLFGDAVPSGKLAETWPVKLEDNPSYLNFPGCDGQVDYREGIYIGYRYYDKKKMQVNFPFGHGLSYTEFAYSDIEVEKAAERADSGNEYIGAGNVDDVLKSEASQPDAMTDTGADKDSESKTKYNIKVSCKVKNVGSVAAKEAVQLYIRSNDPIRPIRELKGFQKINLAPGEEATVAFSLDMRSFAYYEPRIHDWYVASGEYQIEIGASSRDIRLSTSIQLPESTELPVTYTRESTVGDLMKTSRGRALFEQMFGMQQSQESAASNQDESMGEGGAKMAQAMMMEMPLQSIVSFGRMTMEQLDGIVAMLNR